MAQTVAYFCFHCTKVKLETPVTKKTVAYFAYNMESLCIKITTAVTQIYWFYTT